MLQQKGEVSRLNRLMLKFARSFLISGFYPIDVKLRRVL